VFEKVPNHGPFKGFFVLGMKEKPRVANFDEHKTRGAIGLLFF
jgi:hypothetical protein